MVSDSDKKQFADRLGATRRHELDRAYDENGYGSLNLARKTGHKTWMRRNCEGLGDFRDGTTEITERPTSPLQPVHVLQECGAETLRCENHLKAYRSV